MMLDILRRAGVWILNILIGVDVTANAILFGHRYETISSRIGASIEHGGWAASVRWPAWLEKHFITSIEVVKVSGELILNNQPPAAVIVVRQDGSSTIA
jgi:hypothetical protein